MPPAVRLSALLLLLGAAACGQKGPLILPDARTATPVSKPAEVPAAGSPVANDPAADKKDKSRPR